MVYLARYMRVPLSELETMTEDEVSEWTAAVSELIKHENGTEVVSATKSELDYR